MKTKQSLSIPLVLISILIISATLISTAAFAEIYRWVDSDGTVVYSDRPQEGAKTLTLDIPKPGLTSPPGTNRDTGNNNPADGGKTGYKKFTIVAPENDATITDNTGTVSATIVLDPRLDTKSGHVVSIKMDGKPIIEGSTSTQFILNNVDRGTHTIQATVSDAKGKVLKTSNSITFHVKRQSVLAPKPK